MQETYIPTQLIASSITVLMKHDLLLHYQASCMTDVDEMQRCKILLRTGSLLIKHQNSILSSSISTADLYDL